MSGVKDRALEFTLPFPSVLPAPAESAAPSPSASPAPSPSASPAPSPSASASVAPSPTPALPAEEEMRQETAAPVQVVQIDSLTAFGLGCASMLLVLLLAAGATALVRRLRRSRMCGRTVELEPPAPTPVPRGAWTLCVGRVHEQGARKYQQDSFALSAESTWQERGLLAVVADGMGGLSDGDLVSQTAAAAMQEAFLTVQGTPEQVLLQCLARANAAVNRLLGPEGLGRSGTTLLAGLIREGRLSLLSVGDSRAALLRDGALLPLNREHVYREELALDAVNGAGSVQAAWTHPQAGGLTSYLGMGRLRYIDLPAQPLELRAGDRLLLMSDGVYNALTPEEIRAALALPAEAAADALRSAIQEKNYPTQDNYTAILLEMRPAAEAGA